MKVQHRCVGINVNKALRLNVRQNAEFYGSKMQSKHYGKKSKMAFFCGQFAEIYVGKPVIDLWGGAPPPPPPLRGRHASLIHFTPSPPYDENRIS